MSDDRRTVLKVIGSVVGAGAAALVGVPAIGVLVHPISSDTVRGATGFVPVADAGAIPEDGTPRKVAVVVQEPRDAWNKLPPTEVGAIYLRKQGGAVVAYSTVCPHLGCGIDLSADKSTFTCPCHESAFGLDGSVSGGPSPRPLDTLETRLRDGRVEVRYTTFKSGTPEKVAT